MKLWCVKLDRKAEMKYYDQTPSQEAIQDCHGFLDGIGIPHDPPGIRARVYTAVQLVNELRKENERLRAENERLRTALQTIHDTTLDFGAEEKSAAALRT